MIPQETVDQILDTARIEEVIGDFVTLKRRGANFTACCPFHNEKTPSFYVSPSKGIYKCFGCGKAGSAVAFVMDHEHCSYADALRYLARRYHIEIKEKEESAEEAAQKQRRESLLLVSEWACKYFNGQLQSGEGRAVGYAYFKKRELDDQTIEAFSLGWAPSGRTALTDAAQAAGFKLEYLLAAGLAVEKEDGTVVDKFRERVMFPIHSVSGRVVAFSGRTLRADNPAKYVNSPETEIYVKSRNLLGIYFAKAEISRMDRCILVEGNVDMVMMHQKGIRNVVASCGTSLTVEQIRLIRKFTTNMTIMYDGDSAGIHAALRGINLVLTEGMDVKIVLLPEGEDPDSFARQHTAQEVQDFIAANERDFISFKADLLLDDAAGDPMKKANLINDIADTIAQIPDAVKRSVYVESVASKFRIESNILFQRISGNRQEILNAGRTETTVVQAPEENVLENLIVAPVEKDLLSFMLKYGTDVLEFESDSPFYPGDGEDKPTVTDFITSAIDSEGGGLLNSLYQRVYEAYTDAYFQGYPQEVILKSLYNSEDRDVALAATELSIEQHQLTVSKYEASLTTTSSWLVTQVPKAIVLYMDKKLDSRIDALKRQLPSTQDPDKVTEILTEIVTLQHTQKNVKEKLKNI